MKSIKCLTIIITTFCLTLSSKANEEALSGSGSFFTGGEYYEGSYPKINEYLIKTVKTRDVTESLEAAQNWLNTEFANDVPLLKKPLFAALKQFVALSRVTSSNKCDMNEYAILFKNDKATSAHTNKDQTRIGPIKLVENVIYRVSLEHAKHCQGYYEATFASKYQTLDKEQIKRYELFVGPIIEDRVEKYVREMKIADKFSLMNSILYSVFIHDEVASLKDDGQLVYSSLKLLTGLDSAELDKQKVVSVFLDYIVKPCKYYINEMSSIFEPAKYDAKWYLGSKIGYTLSAATFYSRWAGYYICNRLVKYDEADLLKGVIRVAASQQV